MQRGVTVIAMSDEPISSPPQPDRPGSASLRNDVKQWAVLAHLLVLFGFFVPVVGFAGPAAIKFTKGRESQFVDIASTEALNFGITLAIVNLLLGITATLSSIFSFPDEGGVAWAAVGAAAVFCVMWAIIRVRSGKPGHYLVAFRFLQPGPMLRRR